MISFQSDAMLQICIEEFKNSLLIFHASNPGNIVMLRSGNWIPNFFCGSCVFKYFHLVQDCQIKYNSKPLIIKKKRLLKQTATAQY